MVVKETILFSIMSGVADVSLTSSFVPKWVKITFYAIYAECFEEYRE